MKHVTSLRKNLKKVLNFRKEHALKNILTENWNQFPFKKIAFFVIEEKVKHSNINFIENSF